jgi:hypothetical protein
LTFRENQTNANIDYRINEKNWLAAKILPGEADVKARLASIRGNRQTVPGFVTNKVEVRVLVVQDIHTFNPRTFNEARIGYNILRGPLSPFEPVNDQTWESNEPTRRYCRAWGSFASAPAAGAELWGCKQM